MHVNIVERHRTTEAESNSFVDKTIVAHTYVMRVLLRENGVSSVSSAIAAICYLARERIPREKRRRSNAVHLRSRAYDRPYNDYAVPSYSRSHCRRRPGTTFNCSTHIPRTYVSNCVHTELTYTYTVWYTVKLVGGYPIPPTNSTDSETSIGVEFLGFHPLADFFFSTNTPYEYRSKVLYVFFVRMNYIQNIR